jgi:hypothetical protein
MLADRRVAVLGIAFLLVLVFSQVVTRIKSFHTSKPDCIASNLGPTPDQRLTPRAIRKVSIGEICSIPHEEVIRAVPATVRQAIFQEYGLVKASPNDYEIDYLIAPGLGGADDIHNLWPEPYTTTMWDAHVKDGLEERLHEMVCSGQLDLTTAQNDIASNWIAAYKKYFHSDKPIRYAPALKGKLERDSFGSISVATTVAGFEVTWRTWQITGLRECAEFPWRWA